MIGLGLVLLIASLLRELFPQPTDFYWETIEPWKDCPDCNGTGKVECVYTGSGDFIECPCTMQLMPIYS